jgi:hypothetical protein
MSWNMTAAGDAGALRVEFDELSSADKASYPPPSGVCSGIATMLSSYGEASTVVVETSGHIDGSGTCLVSIKPVGIMRSLRR